MKLRVLRDSEYSLQNVAICPSAWFILKNIDGNENEDSVQTEGEKENEDGGSSSIDWEVPNTVTKPTRQTKQLISEQ